MFDNFFDKYFAWLRFTLALILALPIFVAAGTLSLNKSPIRASLLSFVVLIVSCLLTAWFWRLLGPALMVWEKAVERQSTAMERAIPKLSSRTAAVSIVLATACSLLLELSLIRWQASLYEIFSFYKNFMLLASFAGLGIGYACSRRRIVYPIFLPLAAVTIGSMVCLRYGIGENWQMAFHFLPVLEQLAMGTDTASSITHFFSIYALLTAVFCITVLLLLPLGQICGRLMSTLPNLRAYSLNLAGSLLGVLLMIFLSQLWTPPIVWFAFAMCMALPFLFSSRRALLQSGIACLLGVAALSVAVPFGYECIYSPYQLLQRGKGDAGLMIQIIAAGQYYQRILDLSPSAQIADPRLKQFAFYYGLPYQFKRVPDSVLIIGAGTGNDVAAALRNGAKHVDAVEIDPAIYKLGVLFHPEEPYQSPKVVATVTDARQFLRTSKNKYDLIIFGLLDSHAAISQGSQLRTDSYIYTVEAFKEVREHLKDDGIVTLSFANINEQLSQKLKLMIKEVFQSEPKSIFIGYDRSFTLIQSKSGLLATPRTLDAFEKAGFLKTGSSEATKLGKIDLSTDDWPFFYMVRKQFPLSYAFVLMLIIGLTVTMLYTFQDTSIKLFSKGLPFMFLGIGFMLIETKAITELGLYFGNTWQITGIVVAAILIMAFVANVIIERFKPSNVFLPAACLLCSLGIGIYLHQSGINVGPVIATIVLTLPLLFSGVVFSILLNKYNDIGAAMSLNLLGALIGGSLEYMALWVGYQALYVLAIAVYGVALLYCKSSD